MSNDLSDYMVGLVAIMVGAAGLCLVAYETLVDRDRIRDRVKLFAPRQYRAGPDDDPQTRIDGELGGLGASALSGDEQKLGRLAGMRLPAGFARRIHPVLKLGAGGITALLVLLLARQYFASVAMPVLAGISLLGLFIGWLMPGVIADRLALRRRRAVTRGLPDAIELLVVSVEAGLSLEDAINRIVTELRRSQPAIAAELAQTSADLHILPDRDEALRRLADRVDTPSVQSVVSTLSQTLRYGTPLAQALRVVAAELREDALTRLEEHANRIPVLLTVPMIVFLLPSIFLIIGGPAFLKVMDVLARMG